MEQSKRQEILEYERENWALLEHMFRHLNYNRGNLPIDEADYKKMFLCLFNLYEHCKKDRFGEKLEKALEDESAFRAVADSMYGAMSLLRLYALDFENAFLTTIEKISENGVFANMVFAHYRIKNFDLLYAMKFPILRTLNYVEPVETCRKQTEDKYLKMRLYNVKNSISKLILDFTKSIKKIKLADIESDFFTVEELFGIAENKLELKKGLKIDVPEKLINNLKNQINNKTIKMPSGKKCFDDEKLENNPEEKAKFEKRCEKFQLKREHTKFKDILSKATLKDLFRQLPSSLKRGSSDLENIVADLSHEEITASNKSYVIQDFRDNSISIDRARHAIDVAEHEEEDRVFRLVHDKINDRQSYKKIKDFKKRLELDESDRYYDNTPFCRTREDVRTENQRIHDEVESLKDEFSRPKMVTRSEKLKNEFFKDNYLCEPKKSVYLDAAGLSFLYWFCANCKVHFQKEKLSCPICRYRNLKGVIFRKHVSIFNISMASNYCLIAFDRYEKIAVQALKDNRNMKEIFKAKETEVELLFAKNKETEAELEKIIKNGRNLRNNLQKEKKQIASELKEQKEIFEKFVEKMSEQKKHFENDIKGKKLIIKNEQEKLDKAKSEVEELKKKNADLLIKHGSLSKNLAKALNDSNSMIKDKDQLNNEVLKLKEKASESETVMNNLNEKLVENENMLSKANKINKDVLVEQEKMEKLIIEEKQKNENLVKMNLEKEKSIEENAKRRQSDLQNEKTKITKYVSQINNFKTKAETLQNNLNDAKNLIRQFNQMKIEKTEDNEKMRIFEQNFSKLKIVATKITEKVDSLETMLENTRKIGKGSPAPVLVISTYTTLFFAILIYNSESVPFLEHLVKAIKELFLSGFSVPT